MPWVGKHLFGLDITVRTNGSGDTTYNYVQILCFAALSAAAALVWTLLDRRRPHYARLYEWLRVYVRFGLAVAMIEYGGEVIPGPVRHALARPPDAAVRRRLADGPPVDVHGRFHGLHHLRRPAEMIAGLLLTFRRTALLGALLCAAAMANVVMLNFSYDVPVKLYSSHLLAMGVFLTLPDLRRLANLFVLNRPVEAAAVRPPRARFRRAALVAQALLVAAYSGYLLSSPTTASKDMGNLDPATLRSMGSGPSKSSRSTGSPARRC